MPEYVGPSKFWTVTCVVEAPFAWDARDVWDEMDWLVNENIEIPMVGLLCGNVKEGTEDG